RRARPDPAPAPVTPALRPVWCGIIPQSSAFRRTGYLGPAPCAARGSAGWPRAAPRGPGRPLLAPGGACGLGLRALALDVANYVSAKTYEKDGARTSR